MAMRPGKSAHNIYLIKVASNRLLVGFSSIDIHNLFFNSYRLTHVYSLVLHTLTHTHNTHVIDTFTRTHNTHVTDTLTHTQTHNTHVHTHTHTHTCDRHTLTHTTHTCTHTHVMDTHVMDTHTYRWSK